MPLLPAQKTSPTALRRAPAFEHGSSAKTARGAPPRLGACLLLALITAAPSGLAASERDGSAGADTLPGRPLCLYVSSYHRGYSWSDDVERGLRETLGDRCELVQFDMDTKRRRAREEMAAAASSALDLIRELKPDIVITSDDNAARHLVVPHLRDGDTPVVFCGINWTVEEYGLPTSSVTGIVEIAPVAPMIREALTIVPDARSAVYIGGDTLTERKNHARVTEMSKTFGVTLDSLLVEDFDEWKRAYDAAQAYDFVIMGNYFGIAGWDEAQAIAHVLANTRRPSLTNHDWMMPVTTIGYTKIPEEHGERAASMALAILDGTEVRDIPLIVNRRWDTWLNARLAAAIDTPIPERLVRRAKQIGDVP